MNSDDIHTFLEEIANTPKKKAFQKAWSNEIARRLKDAALRHAARLDLSSRERKFMFGTAKKPRGGVFSVFGYVPVLAADRNAKVEDGKLYGAQARYKAVDFYTKNTRSRSNQIFGVYRSKTGSMIPHVARMNTSPFEEVMNSPEYDEIVLAAFEAVMSEFEGGTI